MENSSVVNKSSVEEIRKRFDNDVERFSNLETGQVTIMDAPIMLELVSGAAQLVNPKSKSMLDIGCGGGNFTLKMLQKIPDMDCTLIDLSQPMLNRAHERIAAVTNGNITAIQANILEAELPAAQYDIVFAGSVLHHLRTDEDWETVFSNIFKSLKPGGSFWISDLINHDTEALNTLFNERYRQYLIEIGGEAYSQHVLDYIAAEDTPRSVTFQVELMRKVGFKYVEILHKNTSFASFGGIK